MVVVVVLLVLLAGVLAVALAGAVAVVRRERAELQRARERVRTLEADLDAALRPPPAASPTERALRRVVRTAGKVRAHGISAVLASSIDDLQTWALDQRADIVSMASSDGTVTLFFSDIVDSTPLNDRLGDAMWVRVLAAHESLLRGRVDKYRGQVVKGYGDGFMVAFRDAEAACRAAVEIQRDLRKTLDPRLRVVAPIKVRIGVHTGPVVSRDGDYFGRNVAMAARVGALATGGEILATNAVRDALDDDAAVELVEMGEVELKGLPGTHRVWRVTTT